MNGDVNGDAWRSFARPRRARRTLETFLRRSHIAHVGEVRRLEPGSMPDLLLERA
ncbi:hypothetical protein [Methylocella sp.]|uniref:hypothetical protein n=1 Tax=Methylocella sp. TaxID=1978226 RepID=UPI0037833B9B